MPTWLLLASLLPTAPFDSAAHLQLGQSQAEQWAQARFTLAESLQTSQGEDSHDYTQSSTWASLETWGQIIPQVQFQSKVSVFTDLGNRNYPFHDYEAYRGLAYNTQGDGHRTWDYLTATTHWQAHAHLEFSAGLDYLQLGPSQRNPLAWSGEQSPFRPWMDSSSQVLRPAPVIFGAFAMQISRAKYLQYSGLLQHQKGDNKYFHTHRLEFPLPAHWELGLQETVIYGSAIDVENSPFNRQETRDMAWLYAMPFVPYMFAGHYYGDRDNAALGFDIQWQPHENLRAYGELFLDDSKSPTSLFDDSWWGNKWAFSGGLQAKHHWAGLSWEVQTEYTEIMPWVYTHHLGPSHQYTNFGQSLGSNLGPNSREIFAQLQIQKKCLQLKMHMASVSKDTAFGSAISDIHTATDAINRVVLNPSSTLYYQEAGMHLAIHPSLPFFVEMGATHFYGDYSFWRSDLTLGGYW